MVPKRMASAALTREALVARITACHRCPRLVEYRERMARSKRKPYLEWEYWGRPVPGFGDLKARVTIIGLAPASHGGNRTGRVFTGDPSARFLMRALHKVGYANQPTSEHRDDGLHLSDLYITAAVKCAPPQDRPSHQEVASCLSYLSEELRMLDQLRVVVTLGKVALDAYLRHVSGVLRRPVRLLFHHGACYPLPSGLPILLVSYHPSPRNTQTGRLRYQDLVALLRQSQQLAAAPEAPDEG